MIFHEDYDGVDLHNDIALIKLDQEVGHTDEGSTFQLFKVRENPFVGPVCLPWGDKGEDYLR